MLLLGPPQTLAEHAPSTDPHQDVVDVQASAIVEAWIATPA
ncbi:hypothetical protein [Curtobacterium sp. SL109]|jgi:hypothetical protein|nr:hypothetical protein [Curtobacterium sp. SL109]MCY1694475.1 hypothetical protein [Curtobacterium sp. SL109]